MTLRAARKGDVIAKNIFQEVGRNLGIGVVNLISLFDPEIIAVGGGGAKAGELIFHPMRELVINFKTPIFKSQGKVAVKSAFYW